MVSYFPPEGLSKRHEFLNLLAACLLQSGSPPHEVYDRLKEAGLFLQVDSQITIMDDKMMITFEEPDEPACSKEHFVQPVQSLNLNQMQEVNMVFQAVLAEKMTLESALIQLEHIRSSVSSYSFIWQLGFGFILGSAVCSIGFSGSPADMGVSGCLGVLVVGLLKASGSNNMLFQSVSE